MSRTWDPCTYRGGPRTASSAYGRADIHRSVRAHTRCRVCLRDHRRRRLSHRQPEPKRFRIDRIRRQRCRAARLQAAAHTQHPPPCASRKPPPLSAACDLPRANYRCRQALRSGCRYHPHRSLGGMLALPASRACKASHRNRPINPRSTNNRSFTTCASCRTPRSCDCRMRCPCARFSSGP